MCSGLFCFLGASTVPRKAARAARTFSTDRCSSAGNLNLLSACSLTHKRLPFSEDDVHCILFTYTKPHCTVPLEISFVMSGLAEEPDFSEGLGRWSSPRCDQEPIMKE